MAVVHFEGKAMQWYDAYVTALRLKNLTSWQEYTQILLDQFREVYEDLVAELMKLRQKGSIVDYQAEFDYIVYRVNA